MTVLTLAAWACIGVSAAAAGALPTIFVSNWRRMYREPDFQSWPAVARCRLCDRRVFVWQRYERRAMSVTVDGSPVPGMSVGMSCLVHQACKGTPYGGTVSISVVNAL
jgi:hypothetical protein